MVKIDAVLDKNGILRSCSASGHCGAGKTGTDIVCAAVTVLLRTALSVLSDRKGVNIKGSAPKPGELWLETDYEAEGREFLFAAGAFLIDGLKSIAQEYPENCELNIKEI